MPDDLRTRIADVVRREVPCHPPAADRIADAVIRELDLSIPCAANGCKVRRLTRYHAEKHSGDLTDSGEAK